jgi:hypothetical protein
MSGLNATMAMARKSLAENPLFLVAVSLTARIPPCGERFQTLGWNRTGNCHRIATGVLRLRKRTLMDGASFARPCLTHRLNRKYSKILVHPLRAGFNVSDDHAKLLPGGHLDRRARPKVGLRQTPNQQMEGVDRPNANALVESRGIGWPAVASG